MRGLWRLLPASLDSWSSVLPHRDRAQQVVHTLLTSNSLMAASERNSSELGGSHLVQFYSRSATTMIRDRSNTEGDARLDRGRGSGHKPFLEAVGQEGVAVVSNDARSNAMHGSGSTAVVHGLACVTSSCSSDW
jgi:hypothetical protein